MLWRDRARQKLHLSCGPCLCIHLSVSSVVILTPPEMGEGLGRGKGGLWGEGEVAGARLHLLNGD